MSISRSLALDRVTRIASLSSFSVSQLRCSPASCVSSTRHYPSRPAASLGRINSTDKDSSASWDSPLCQPLIAAGLAAALLASAPRALAEAAVAAADGAAAGSAASAAVQACGELLGGADFNTVVAVTCALEFIALTGAAVGGYMALQQGAEMERINKQLRQINMSLKRQARLDAPSLAYSPPPPSAASPAASTSSMAEAAAAPAAEALDAARATAMAEMAHAASDERAELIRMLKEGKKHLRDGHPGSAFVEFHVALSKAKELGDAVEEKKAARGLGAACQRQGKYKEAIGYHQLVLEKSMATGEHSGDTEAYGAIADCYTELRDTEKAAIYYDKYINRLEQDSDEE